MLGRIVFNNASGLEQPAWNPASGRFYISVPSTGANPGGEIAEIDVTSLTISRVLPLPECIPAGIVFGPGQNLFVGCSQDQILTYGTAFSPVIDVATGRIIANISGLSGIDQVAYDPAAMLYYASAYQNLAGGSKSGTPTPQLGIVDARSNTLLQTLTTDNVTAHSVAVDPKTNQVIVPLAKDGIAVYSPAANSTGGSQSGNGTATATQSGAAKQTNTGRANRPAACLSGIAAVASFLLAMCAV